MDRGAVVVVRAARVTDAEALGALHVAAWQVAYRGLMSDEYLDGLDPVGRATQWREAMAAGPPRARSARLVADVDGTAVGFALVGPAAGDEDADVGELYALNVAPAHWGEGHGGALMAAAEVALADAGFGDAVLWVHPGNDRARRFYEHHGWTATDDVRDEEVLGVVVPEVRYERSLQPTDVGDQH